MPAEYRAVWTTPGGGTGYSVFHWETAVSTADAQALANATRAFFLALNGWLPDDVTVSFENELIVMDAAGTLLAVYPVTPPANVVGINTSAFNRASGARIDWATGQIVAGRRLTGRTYMVPTGSTVFDTLGQVTAANVTAGQTAAANFITASAATSELVVWSRAHAVQHPVLTGSVPTKGAILRGRRD